MRARQGTKHKLAVCVYQGDYLASLETRKIYEVIPDRDAGKHDQLRVIDESGEDYLYPKEYFVLINLPTTTQHLLWTKPNKAPAAHAKQVSRR